ncbi:MAG: DHCW motif cupin fold protein [Candidatus Aminicenantaceae bacterium]
MKIQDVPFEVTDWGQMTLVEHAGEKGTSQWRTFHRGNIRVRMVEYLPGFYSDHWCRRGHVLLVLEGELVIQLRDGREFVMKPGTSFQAEDDEANPHLAFTDKGAKVFIVD